MGKLCFVKSSFPLLEYAIPPSSVCHVFDTAGKDSNENFKRKVLDLHRKVDTKPTPIFGGFEKQTNTKVGPDDPQDLSFYTLQ